MTPESSYSKNTYTLYPGEIFATAEAMTISTILGSCVAVCLWDRSSQIGGMNHIVLPTAPKGPFVSSKYGNVATMLLYDLLRNQGANLHELEAKIFGGSQGISVESMNESFAVGSQNIEAAHHSLEKLKIPIVAHDVGGSFGRKILFDTQSGVVQRKTLVKFDFQKEFA